jgi:hypothetical protein
MSSPADEANDWNRKIIEEFRANRGKVGGNFAGAPLLLLHTVGASSGRERVNPLMYKDLGNGGVAVFATIGVVRPAIRTGTTISSPTVASLLRSVPRRASYEHVSRPATNANRSGPSRNGTMWGSRATRP